MAGTDPVGNGTVRRPEIRPGGATPAKGPGIRPEEPAYTVTLSGRGDISPGAPKTAGTGGAIPVEDNSPSNDSVTKTLNLLSTLFGSNFPESIGIPKPGEVRGMGDWLRAPASRDSEGNILVGQQKGKIKEFVAKAIWGQHWERHKDEITDAALDYFFGNQDGKLADNETISITDLNKRLEFMIPIFSTQAAAGGNSAASYLETKNIILVEYKPEYLSGVNFGALAKAKDPMLMTCLSLAYSKYKPETNEEALAAREAMILAEKGDGSFYSKMPEKMKQQLFAAYWGAFQYECLKNGRKIPENYKDDQNYVKNLIGGAFLNWVDGKLPNAKPGETGRILPDSLESDAVKGAKEYRDKQVGNAAEAARKESESKGNIPVPSDK